MSSPSRKTHYWVVSPMINGPEYYDRLEKWKDLIIKNRAYFMGWPMDPAWYKEHPKNSDQLGLKFATEVLVGDVMLIAHGRKPHPRLLACGIVATRAIAPGEKVSAAERLVEKPPKDYDFGSYRLLHPFRVFDNEDPAHYGLSFNGASTNIKAIYELDPDRRDANKRVCDKLASIIAADAAGVPMNEQERLESLENVLRSKGQIILQGPPGTGKTRLAKRLAARMLGLTPDNVDMEENEQKGAFHDLRFSGGKPAIVGKGNWSIVQFHPSYNYEDFVRGIRPVTGDKDAISYETQDRIFAELARYAQSRSDKEVVLIIDEINRANLAAVLGELIYALEYRGVEVRTPYTPKGFSDSSILVPKNLHIIGTMNTADRSIGHIDYAIRRRFAFEYVGADSTAIEQRYKKPAEAALKTEALDLFQSVEGFFFRKAATGISERSEYLSRDFDPKDVQIGHSYFLAKDPQHLKIKCLYEVVPILEEYVKDGVLNEGALTAINDLRERIKAL
jgi:MoxR-like ATPase